MFQAISIGNWDREYIHMPIGPGGSDYVRLLSDQQNTVIGWTSQDGSSGSIFINKGNVQIALLAILKQYQMAY